MGEFSYYILHNYLLFFKSHTIFELIYPKPAIVISADFHILKDHFLAAIPTFMKSINRIIGGEDAPSPIPWQVSIKYGCSGTILDSTTVLSAAHCPFFVGEPIRAGSVKLDGGGQVF